MHKTQKRRRHEQKTDYMKRLGLLKSGKPRVVVRKTNKYITAHFVESVAAQDKTTLSISSRDLLEYGWPKELTGSLKSLPAAYLTGLLLGKKIGKSKEIIFDLGVAKNAHKGKIFAFVKGVKDSGVKLEADEKVFPEKERLEGKHLQKDFSKTFNEIKMKIEKEK